MGYLYKKEIENKPNLIQQALHFNNKIKKKSKLKIYLNKEINYSYH